MNDSLKRNLIKVGLFAGLAWVSYKVVTGLAKNKSAETIVKETVAPVAVAAETIKQTAKKFLKGSPEAKEHMAKLRSMHKKKLTEKKVDELIKDEKKGAAEYEKVGLPTIAKDEKKHEKILEKIETKKEKFNYEKHTGFKKSNFNEKESAGRKGGKATAKLGKHKGHKSKKGLSQDQKLKSKETHEKNYRKSKGK